MLIESKCRNCNDPFHVGICILVEVYYHPTDKEDLIEERACGCKEYIPSDNLQYLEWMNEKRSKNETNS